MAKEPKPVDPDQMGRFRQFIETYRMARKVDPRLPLWLLGAFVGGAAIGFGLLTLLPGASLLQSILRIVSALLFGTLFAMIVFGRRAQTAAYKQMDGQPGAAAAALRMVRRGWRTDPVIAFAEQEVIGHRVGGGPGSVRVGEGNPNRVKQ